MGQHAHTCRNTPHDQVYPPRGTPVLDHRPKGEQAKGHGHHVRSGRRRREVEGTRDEVHGRRHERAPAVAEPDARKVVDQVARGQPGERRGHPRLAEPTAQDELDQGLEVEAQRRQRIQDHVRLEACRARLARGDVRDLGEACLEDGDPRHTVPILILPGADPVHQGDVPGQEEKRQHCDPDPVTHVHRQSSTSRGLVVAAGPVPDRPRRDHHGTEHRGDRSRVSDGSAADRRRTLMFEASPSRISGSIGAAPLLLDLPSRNRDDVG
jgi:hypothetical protein